VGHAPGQPQFLVKEVEEARVAELPEQGQPVELGEGEEDVDDGGAFPA
jgi:hypothetical protein